MESKQIRNLPRQMRTLPRPNWNSESAQAKLDSNMARLIPALPRPDWNFVVQSSTFSSYRPHCNMFLHQEKALLLFCVAVVVLRKNNLHSGMAIFQVLSHMTN